MGDARWKAVYDAFDPTEPVGAGPRWVPRTYDVADDIARRLNRAFGDRRFLLTGTVGSGKSSELGRILDAASRTHLVVRLDLVRHFDDAVRDSGALQGIEPWEVVELVGLAVVRACQEQFRWPIPDPTRAALVGAIAQLRGKTPAEIDLGKLAAGVGGVAASVAGAVVAGGVPGAAGALVGATIVGTAASTFKELASAVRWTQPLRKRGDLGSQSTPVQDLIVAVNGLLSELKGAFVRPVLIAIDGLDRVKGREDNERLWVDTDLLSRFAAYTVAVGSVVFQRSGMGGQVRGFSLVALRNEPVLQREAPHEHGPGVAFFERLFGARRALLEGVGPVIPEAGVRRLAYFSAGHVRGFMHLVREVAQRAYDRDLLVADDAVIDAAIADRRALIERGFTAAYVAVLRQVVQDPWNLPSGPEADAALTELLDQGLLLPYPNESEWWYPHTLLLKNKVRPGG